MIIPLAEVTRIVVFVHPGSLKNGVIHLVVLTDADPSFREQLKAWKDDLCIYDGPPMPELPKGGRQ